MRSNIASYFFKYVILSYGKMNTWIHFRENWLIFLGLWGEAVLFLGIWEAKANTFRETRKLFAMRRGDECIIFRDQGSTDPPSGALIKLVKDDISYILFKQIIHMFSHNDSLMSKLTQNSLSKHPPKTIFSEYNFMNVRILI